MARTRSYDDFIVEHLRDPKEAAAYLNAHLEDDSEDAEGAFLLALRDVAKAHGITTIADETKLGRESLYKSLSENGNPKLTTLWAIINALGLRFAIKAKKNLAT